MKAGNEDVIIFTKSGWEDIKWQDSTAPVIANQSQDKGQEKIRVQDSELLILLAK